MSDPYGVDAILSLGAELGVQLNGSQASTLLAYLDLLARWNVTYNLTAVRSREGLWTQHLADSLAVVSPLQAQLPSGRVLDVGSGGGLPGAVIAACLPRLEVSCVDAVAKKAAFLRQVAGELKLPHLLSIHARVEALKTPVFDVVISRAFASLANFVTLTHSALAPQGVWLAMKGKTPDEEMAALPATVDVFHVEQLKVPGLDARRCLVWMRRSKKA